MRTKSNAQTEPGQAPISNRIQTLLGDLTAEELDRMAIAVIRDHRNKLQQAQTLFEEMERREAAGADDEDLSQLTHDYRLALLNLHIQHQLVAVVVDRLGYVPEVDGQRPVLN